MNAHNPCQDPSCLLCSREMAAHRPIRAQIGDLGALLGKTIQALTPQNFVGDEIFNVCGNKIYLKFDEIAIFYSPAAQQMVIAYSVAGKQVYWEPCPIPGFKGELVLTNLVGWQEIGVSS